MQMHLSSEEGVLFLPVQYAISLVVAGLNFAMLEDISSIAVKGDLP